MAVGWAPLLPPGRHVMNLTGVHSLCVEPFEEQKTRQIQFDNLKTIAEILEAADIRCDLWIDGSYVTTKPTPGDIDVIAAIDYDLFQAMSDSAKTQFATLFKGGKVFDGTIDAYCCPTALRDSSSVTKDESQYWAELIGIDTDGYLKGFAVLEIGGAS